MRKPFLLLLSAFLLTSTGACSDSNTKKENGSSEELVWQAVKTISAEEGSILGKSAVRVISTWRGANNMRMGSPCGGVLIAKRAVLSVANCFDEQDTKEKVLVVFPGEGSYRESNIVTGAVRIHPGYSGQESNDPLNLAIVLLDSDAPSNMQSVAVLEVEDLTTLRSIYTGGYGLMRAIQPGKLWEQRIEFKKDRFSTFFTSADGKNSCKGDTGGPVVTVKDSGEIQLVGMTTLSLLDCEGENTYFISLEGLMEFIHPHLGNPE